MHADDVCAMTRGSVGHWGSNLEHARDFQGVRDRRIWSLPIAPSFNLPFEMKEARTAFQGVKDRRDSITELRL